MSSYDRLTDQELVTLLKQGGSKFYKERYSEHPIKQRTCIS